MILNYPETFFPNSSPPWHGFPAGPTTHTAEIDISNIEAELNK